MCSVCISARFCPASILVSVYAEGSSSTVHEHVRLPRQYTVDVFQIPHRYVGKTFHAISLRTAFGWTAVAIRRGGFQCPDELPDPDRPLDARDHLVLVGRQEDLRHFRTLPQMTDSADSDETTIQPVPQSNGKSK